MPPLALISQIHLCSLPWRETLPARQALPKGSAAFVVEVKQRARYGNIIFSYPSRA
jgi:hypothetical protein